MGSPAGRSSPGLLRTLGAEGALIGLPRKRARGSGRSTPASHVSISSDEEDSRVSSLGALRGSAAHAGGAAALDEYPTFPRGAVAGDRVAFRMGRGGRAAQRTVAAILVDDDEEDNKAEEPAKAPAASRPGPSPGDFVPLRVSSDSEDGRDPPTIVASPNAVRVVPLPGASVPPPLPAQGRVFVVPSSTPSPERTDSPASLASSASGRKKKRRRKAKGGGEGAAEDGAATPGEGTPEDGPPSPAPKVATPKARPASANGPTVVRKAKGGFAFTFPSSKSAAPPPHAPDENLPLSLGEPPALPKPDPSKPLFTAPGSGRPTNGESRGAAAAEMPQAGDAAEDVDMSFSDDDEAERTADDGSRAASDYLVDVSDLPEDPERDAYTDLSNLRSRKRPRHTSPGADEDFIPLGAASDREESPKPRKERYRPPPTAAGSRPLPHGVAGVAVSPLMALPIPPWIPEGGLPVPPDAHPMDFFNAECSAFVDYISPRPWEHAMRGTVVERVARAVRSVWPNAEVAVFGSFETRMYLPSSDVDLVVFEPSARPPACLDQLARALRQGVCREVEVIASARVPIIKCVDALTLFRADISFNMGSGVDSAAAVKGMLAGPNGAALRGLMAIMKQFLLQRDLNEVFSGGLGSYGLVIMIANFLALHPLLQAGIVDPSASLGTLFMDFLELYGKNLSHSTVGIGLDADGQGYYYQRRGGRGGGISVADPLDASNDVTRGSFQYASVRREFGNAHDLLRLIIQSRYAAQHRAARDRARPRGRHTRYGSDGESPPPPPRRRGRDREPSPGPPSTILGAVLRIRKTVQEHRRFVEERYKAIEAGEADAAADGGGVDAEWIREVVEAEGGGGKRKEREEREGRVVYVEAESDEEGGGGESPPRPSKAEQSYEAAMRDLLGDSFDVLSGDYQMVGKVPVTFDDRKGSSKREVWGAAPAVRLRSMEEGESEDEAPVVRPRKGLGEGWD